MYFYKTCGECRFLIPEYDRHGRGKCYYTDNRYLPSCGACKAFAERYGGNQLTVFNRITTSPEVLAKELITTSYDEFKDCTVYWAWLGNGRREAYYSKEEAIAATVAKLKEQSK